MPSFGSLFAALGRALPGYVEGQRAAIQDNWQDLENYNNVRRGQLENLWTEATWDPRLYNVWLTPAANTALVNESYMNLAQRMARHPGDMQAGEIWSANAGRMLGNALNNGGGLVPDGRGGWIPLYGGYPATQSWPADQQQRNLPPQAAAAATDPNAPLQQ